jgi:hypothetical protein
MNEPKIPKLDPREEHFRIPSHHKGMSLFLRYLAPRRPAQIRGNVVLYVHGGTFPSVLSIAHRFDGRSWRDELTAAGFHCWGLDFHGFGALVRPLSRNGRARRKPRAAWPYRRCEPTAGTSRPLYLREAFRG